MRGGSLALVVLVAAALFAIRLSGPTDLADNAQEEPAAYVLDAVRNGRWLVQRDALGRIASKPPLHTWISGAVAAARGGVVDRLTLQLPSGLATLGTAAAILLGGSARFGPAAGLFGALAYLVSPAGAKTISLVRTDALFALAVAAASFLAHRAWVRGGGWTLFWLAAAAAVLAKGPLGVLLASAGLFAAALERRSRRPLPLRGSHTAGVALFAALTGGWFALAYVEEGAPLARKLLLDEAIGHAISDGKGHGPGQGFWKPSLYFLVRSFPWSLLACAGLWRVARRPATADVERRFERFLACGFGAGLLAFSISPHQRPDLLLPILPAAALLTGREAARWVSQSRALAVGTAVAVVGIGAAWFEYHVRRPGVPLVERSVALEDLARDVRDRVGAGFPLTYTTDSPFALQIGLGTLTPAVSHDRAAALLSGDAAAFVVARKRESIERARVDLRSNAIASSRPGPGEGDSSGTGAAADLFAVARWPAGGEAWVSVLSNRPRLEWTSPFEMLYGDLRVRGEEVRLVSASERAFEFAATGSGAAAQLTNESDVPARVRVVARPFGRGGDASTGLGAFGDASFGETVSGGRPRRDVAAREFDRTLAPGESWRVDLDALPASPRVDVPSTDS